MGHGAIDLHKKESQVRLVMDDGIIVDRRIATRRESLTQVFGTVAPMRVLIEASTESEWVACHLEHLGHAVVVADPNYAPMYGGRSRRVKTDLRDAAALALACGQGTYRAVHRRSVARRAVQVQLRVRDELVQTRSRAISLIRAVTRAEGLRIRSGSAETFVRRLEALALPAPVGALVRPLCQMLTTVTAELRTIEDRIAALVVSDADMRRLTTYPGIGPITAAAFVAAIDDVTRFAGPGAVTNYLGLVPQEYSSGEKQRRGHIVRSAQPRVQALLVQAAWRVWLSTRVDTAALRLWAQQVSRRRGARIAIVALARRIARVLFAMWRDGCDYYGARRQEPAMTPGLALGVSA
jgi:transposase